MQHNTPLLAAGCCATTEPDLLHVGVEHTSGGRRRKDCAEFMHNQELKLLELLSELIFLLVLGLIFRRVVARFPALTSRGGCFSEMRSGGSRWPHAKETCPCGTMGM